MASLKSAARWVLEEARDGIAGRTGTVICQ